MSVRVVYRYPVKSCRGESLDRAVVEPWGLAGDRRWMLVDDGGTRVTAREYPDLVLVTPSIDNSKTDNSNKKKGQSADNSNIGGIGSSADNSNKRRNARRADDSHRRGSGGNDADNSNTSENLAGNADNSKAGGDGGSGCADNSNTGGGGGLSADNSNIGGVGVSADNSNKRGDIESADNSNKFLRLEAPGRPELVVPFPRGTAGDTAGELVPVSIGRSELLAARAGEAADEWFTRITGKPVRLVYLDDPTRRATDPVYSQPGDRVSFADGYPLLLVSLRSLERLNDWVAEGAYPAEAPLPVSRFRPNVVIDGAPAFAEDDWKRIRISGAEFRVAKRCDRCVLTTIDPDSAARHREPLPTLARHRRWDGKVWFGVNLIPDPTAGESAVLGRGDPVEVLG